MDAIPLAPRANLDHYRKLAKELLGVCQSKHENAVQVWARRWLERLAKLGSAASTFRTFDNEAEQVAVLVREAKETASLADAQHLLAGLHGFESWPRFVKHLRDLQRASTEEAQFEAAAEAVVTGDLVRLRSFWRAPALIRARSSRRHRSTLLHYAVANGIEVFRQRTPANIVSVARLLIEAGAEIDAVNDESGGGGTALGMVAMSAHPRRAGVQQALMELLVAAGAKVNGVPGEWKPMRAALANGCPGAADWLAAHGAQMDVVTAACFGRVDVLERWLAEEVANPAELEEALIRACGCGKTAAAKLLLDRGVDIGALHGQTGLHLATHSAHLETVRFLLSRKGPLEGEEPLRRHRARSSALVRGPQPGPRLRSDRRSAAGRGGRRRSELVHGDRRDRHPLASSGHEIVGGTGIELGGRKRKTRDSARTCSPSPGLRSLSRSVWFRPDPCREGFRGNQVATSSCSRPMIDRQAWRRRTRPIGIDESPDLSVEKFRGYSEGSARWTEGMHSQLWKRGRRGRGLRSPKASSRQWESWDCRSAGLAAPRRSTLRHAPAGAGGRLGPWAIELI